MRQLLFILSILIPSFVFSQIPNINPRNIQLLYQTTGDGIVWRGGANIDYTPTSRGNAWMHLDTVNNKLYSYVQGQWSLVKAGGVTDVYMGNDTLYITTSDTVFYTVITPDSLQYNNTTQVLSVRNGNSVTLAMNTDTTLSGSNTVLSKLQVNNTYVPLFKDTLTTLATKANLSLKLNSVDTASLSNRIDTKQDIITGAASTITTNNLAPNQALISNSTGKVAISNVTAVELGYLSGVTGKTGSGNLALSMSPTISAPIIETPIFLRSPQPLGQSIIDFYGGICCANGWRLQRTDSTGVYHPANSFILINQAMGYPSGVALTVDRNLNTGLRERFPKQALHVRGKVRADTLSSTPMFIAGIGTDSTLVRLSTDSLPSIAELKHVKGITSTIQTQLNTKQDIITGAATSITSSNLTPSRALISNSAGKVSVSPTIDSTELGYLDGVTSSIQTQLNAKQAQLNGTGFVKVSGTTVTYDNSTYLVGADTVSLSNRIDTKLDMADTTSVILTAQQKQLAYIKNETGSPLTRGQVVYVSGASGNNKLVSLASSSSEATSSKTFGLVSDATIASGSNGYVITFGLLEGVNTDTFQAGAVLYLHTVSGQITDVKPVAPLHMVVIGFCVRVQQNNGAIFVKVQNGYELEELHNVSVVGLAAGKVLKYNGTLWAPADDNDSQVITLTGDVTGSGTGTFTTTLANSGVTAGTYNNSATTVTPLIIDSKGRITGTGTPVTITPAFSSITSKPTTLSGYGITDAVPSSRTITINGTSFDLSENRSWTINSMVYPTAGIAVSTGNAWGPSIVDNSTNWNTAYTDRLKWDGGSTGLNAATGRTSLGATTIGSNLFTLTNPFAVTFPRFNADNTVSALSASDMRTALGAGTVTQVNALTIGTTGTDITSTVASSNTTPTITLNIPTASPTSRGVLSPTDFTTFSNKLTTEVDGNVANEGVLGVGAGPKIISNTIGANGVSILAGNHIDIFGTVNSNGGSITISNIAPDQTVALTGSGATTVTGTYPNFTIGSQNLYTADGDLSSSRIVRMGNRDLTFSLSNFTPATDSMNIALSTASGLQITNTGSTNLPQFTVTSISQSKQPVVSLVRSMNVNEDKNLTAYDPVTNGITLGAVEWHGAYSTSATGLSSYINAQATNNWSTDNNNYSKLIFATKGNVDGSVTEKMEIGDNGQIRFNKYVSNSFTGTRVSFLGVDNSGNVINTSPTTLSGYGITDAISTTTVQDANKVLAGPTTGVAQAPTFRTLQAVDIPSLDASKITTGTLPVARGGTGLSTMTGANRIPYSTSPTAMTTSGDFIYNPSLAQLQIAGIENTAVSNTSFWNGNFIGLDITNNSTTTNTISGIRLRNGSNSVAGIAGIRESSTLTALGFFTGGSGVGGGTVTERMRITSGGNVGIGIAPTKKLEVYGDLANGDGIQLTDASNGYMRIAQSTGSAGVFAGMLSGQAIGDNPSFNLRGIQTATTPRTTATLQLQVANSNEDGAIANTDKAITFLNWSTEMVTVLGNGNVGIGTTTPQSRLDVEGAVAIGASYSGSGPAAPTNGLIVEGNVGIGTNNPQVKLDVNGGSFRVISDGAKFSLLENDVSSSNGFFNLSNAVTAPNFYSPLLHMKGNTTGGGYVNAIIGDMNSDIAGQAALEFMARANGNTVVNADLFRFSNLYGSGDGSTSALVIKANNSVGIGTSSVTSNRRLDVNGEVRIRDLDLTGTPIQLVASDADGNLDRVFLGVLEIDGNSQALTLDNSSVSFEKLTDGAAGGSKLGKVFTNLYDNVDIDLTSLLGSYSQLIASMNVASGATRTITLPTPSITYDGAIVEVFVRYKTDNSGVLNITAAGTNNIVNPDNFEGTYATTFSKTKLYYAKLVCMLAASAGATYKWHVINYSIKP